MGQLGVLREEMLGVECISLNRLHELPEEIIEKIEPVFFPDEKWTLSGNSFHLERKNPSKYITLTLNDIEKQAIELFQRNTRLKQTAAIISRNTGIHADEVYKTVREFFLKLASLRVCHPRNPHGINEKFQEVKHPDGEKSFKKQ
jgi:hypothetical protein